MVGRDIWSIDGAGVYETDELLKGGVMVAVHVYGGCGTNGTTEEEEQEREERGRGRRNEAKTERWMIYVYVCMYVWMDVYRHKSTNERTTSCRSVDRKKARRKRTRRTCMHTIRKKIDQMRRGVGCAGSRG